MTSEECHFQMSYKTIEREREREVKRMKKRCVSRAHTSLMTQQLGDILRVFSRKKLARPLEDSTHNVLTEIEAMKEGTE